MTTTANSFFTMHSGWRGIILLQQLKKKTVIGSIAGIRIILMENSKLSLFWKDASINDGELKVLKNSVTNLREGVKFLSLGIFCIGGEKFLATKKC